MAKGLAVIIVLCVLTGLAPLLPGPGTAGGGMANEGIIMPGKGVDRFSIGAPAPDERKLRAIAQTEGVIIATANGSIRRITVSSPRHTVARSRLRPGAHLSEVLRFFGRGEKEIRGNLVILSYPVQGIEFTIDTGDELVRTITVFSPVRQRAPIEQQRKLYQYREQFKVR